MITISNNMAQPGTNFPQISLVNFLAFLLLFMGISILFFWIVEIAKNYRNLLKSHFNWKNENNEIMWFHVSAELVTAFSLIIAGIATFLGSPFSSVASLFSAGLLFYASLNGLSWVFAEKSRIKLVFPMAAGIVIAVLTVYIHLN